MRNQARNEIDDVLTARPQAMRDAGYGAAVAARGDGRYAAALHVPQLPRLVRRLQRAVTPAEAHRVLA